MSKNYLSAWKNISVRIKSLLESSNILFNSLKVNSSDNGAIKILYESAGCCFKEIQNFKKDFEKSIPEQVVESLEDFLTNKRAFFPEKSNGSHIELSTLNPRLIAIATLENQVSYFLNDTQTAIRKSVEFAFAHLQRRLVADKGCRTIWNAIGNTETDFEKLGGDHLLLHKIWAFKSNAQGERTDLILSEPIREDDPLYSSADGLILTEWKVAKDKNKYLKKIEEAKQQAKIYKFGSLYPVELSNHCFLVIVSEKSLQLAHEELSFKEGEIQFTVVNIAYDREVPSKEARQK